VSHFGKIGDREKEKNWPPRTQRTPRGRRKEGIQFGEKGKKVIREGGDVFRA
jgi:hypothetical protein